jgi:hypothetical protein
MNCAKPASFVAHQTTVAKSRYFKDSFNTKLRVLVVELNQRLWANHRWRHLTNDTTNSRDLNIEKPWLVVSVCQVDAIVRPLVA